ncbi:MAG TPA: hypothetical protein VHG89_04985 [Verrucomicrobiae bacterium]|nr:hypothetical protein [Verrucomicrobiae bacterium]
MAGDGGLNAVHQFTDLHFQGFGDFYKGINRRRFYSAFSQYPRPEPPQILKWNYRHWNRPHPCRRVNCRKTPRFSIPPRTRNGRRSPAITSNLSFWPTGNGVIVVDDVDYVCEAASPAIASSKSLVKIQATLMKKGNFNFFPNGKWSKNDDLEQLESFS